MSHRPPRAGHHNGDRPSSFNVKIWGISTYQGKRKTSHTVRWAVGGRPFRETFDTEKLAEGRRADLIRAQRRGEAFDVERGVPVSELAELLATERAAQPELTWYQHCVRYVDRRWTRLSANSRRSVADTLATVTPALLPQAPGRPTDEVLRAALYQWAFSKNRRDTQEPEPHIRAALDWIAANSPAAADVAEPATVRAMLDALGHTLTGSPAAANTINRKRAVLSNVLEHGVGEFLDGNPLPAAVKQWNPPRNSEEVDPRVVVNPRQAAALIAAMRDLPLSGPRLVAFFGCLYYAALRPSEAVRLRASDLDIPAAGSGTLLVDVSGAMAGRAWTDSGKRRDNRGLKWRSAKEVRPVPCPAVLTQLLHEHLAEFGTTQDGRLFRGIYRGELSESVYERLLKRARTQVFTKAEAASPLARRPYDLRHAALSTWLNAGIDPAQVAQWAGNSVRVLLSTYAKCVAGRDTTSRRQAEEAFRPSEDTTPSKEPPHSEKPDTPDTQ